MGNQIEVLGLKHTEEENRVLKEKEEKVRLREMLLQIREEGQRGMYLLDKVILWLRQHS